MSFKFLKAVAALIAGRPASETLSFKIGSKGQQKLHHLSLDTPRHSNSASRPCLCPYGTHHTLKRDHHGVSQAKRNAKKRKKQQNATR